MQFAQFKKFEILVSFCCLAMLSYFMWHAFHGARGMPYRDQLVVQLAAITVEATDISTKRQSIESRVKLMRPESVDPDLLDELARRDLFMGKSTDIIVKTSQ
jgi:cell division protein FtsB